MSYNIIVEQQTTRMLVGGLVRVIDELEKENYTHRLHPKHPAFDDGKDLTEYRNKVGIVKEQEQEQEEENTYDGAEDLSRKKALTLAQYERLKLLNAAIRLGKQRKNIPKTLLTKALTVEELKRIEDLYETPHQYEILYGDGMPELLKDYADKVAKADFVYGQKESLKPTSVKRREQIRRLSNKAQDLYDTAVETLEEGWNDTDDNQRMRIQAWLDTHVDDDTFNKHGEGIAFDDGDVPRVRGTSSARADNDPLNSGLPKLSKVIKRKICVYTVLVEAAVELAFELPAPEPEPVIDAAAMRSKLKRLLDNLNSERD